MLINQQQSISRIETIKYFFENRINLDNIPNKEKRLIKQYIEGLEEVRDYILKKPEKIVVGGLKGLILKLLIK